MAENSKNSFWDRIKEWFKTGIRPGDDIQSNLIRREKIIVFLAAYIMAISLWFIVNLSSSFSINVNVPIEAGNVPENMALTEKLPEFVQVGVSGEGWQLFNLYNDPPMLTINVDEGDVNLFEQVRQRLSFMQGIDVSKVQPLLISVNMEPKITKRVPVILHSELGFHNRYGLIGDVEVFPDSITITGAESVVEDIEKWEIQDTLKLQNIKEDVFTSVQLDYDETFMELSHRAVTFRAKVSEFTEGETTIYLRTRNLPRGQSINYNPSSVTIKYDVPIGQYAQVQQLQPYEVYVPYSKIVEDSTGFVTPDIELTATEFELRLRSFQPKAVAYFSVLDQ